MTGLTLNLLLCKRRRKQQGLDCPRISNYLEFLKPSHFPTLAPALTFLPALLRFCGLAPYLALYKLSISPLPLPSSTALHTYTQETGSTEGGNPHSMPPGLTANLSKQQTWPSRKLTFSFSKMTVSPLLASPKALPSLPCCPLLPISTVP